jgi:hypothetical protein
MLEDKITQPKVVMQEHDPNDDPFADLLTVETKQLISPLEYGSGVVSPTKNAPTDDDAARHEDEAKHVDASRQGDDEKDNGDFDKEDDVVAPQDEEKGNDAADDEEARKE